MQRQKIEPSHIMLGLLESVDRDGGQSQRARASEFGVALGLVNAYLKRCVRKGLIKVKEAPARRYTYYLTARGFAEKSRLALEYLSYSLSFFRQARADCSAALDVAKQRGWSRIILAGISDLAEISAICSLEGGIVLCAVVDAKVQQSHFVNIPVFATFDAVRMRFDGVLITDLATAQTTYNSAVKHFGVDRVLVPRMLGVSTRTNEVSSP